ncbi:unnamed protein product [Rotaria magnacalcarata]|uniref:protein-disulfide reductase n=1 Tax=Rotaria magnacalcarata TaxID=392030 RepID=A0A819JRC6_9BILA|nr:unnamed protein product [Rotaria magnacalcarata]
MTTKLNKLLGEELVQHNKSAGESSLISTNRNLPKLLGEKFNNDGISSMVILSLFLQIIILDGIDEVRDANKEALYKWFQGKRLFWTREPPDGEYVWKTTKCTECFMMPMVGVRYSCTNLDCQIDLCEACLSKTKHKHPLVEYLIPKQQHPQEKLLASIPYLPDPNNSDEIDIKNIWKSDIKSIGFYFTVHWCLPGHSFTRELTEFYEEAQTKRDPFHIIYISCDEEEESFNDYRSEMPWLAAPWKLDIPSLIVVSFDGKILSRYGRESRRCTDNYKLLSVSCEGCKMFRLVGQRYHCPTCVNYDLFSTCKKKGHEHALLFQPQPNDNNEE